MSLSGDLVKYFLTCQRKFYQSFFSNEIRVSDINSITKQPIFSLYQKLWCTDQQEHEGLYSWHIAQSLLTSQANSQRWAEMICHTPEWGHGLNDSMTVWWSETFPGLLCPKSEAEWNHCCYKMALQWQNLTRW